MASKGKKTAPINSKLSENVPNGPVSGHAKERSVSFSEDAKFYDDGTRSFFWRAHTVTVLVVICIVLCYMSLYDQSDDTNSNIRRGIAAVVVVFIMIGVVHMPDGPFIRPHPAIWRFALVLMIVYVLLLIFTVFQTADDARYFLTYYDPKLGVPLPEKSYAQDCRIYTPEHPDGPFANVMDKMDVFVPSHFIGWYVKALIIRDFWLLNVISVTFELMEYTLECQLPNFGECWWDHWILDFLICNGLGIYFGMKTCEYLSMKTYHWRGLWKIPTLKGKLKRAVGQFTPYNWEQFKWGYTSSLRSFVFVCILIFMWTLQELNVFYLKTVLWVPPKHTLNFYRELIYGFCGACALNETYTFLQSKDDVTRIGRYSWLVTAALAIETLIVIKFGWEIVTIPLPRMAIILWGLFFAAVIIWAIWNFTYPLNQWQFIGSLLKRKEKKQ